VVTVDVYKSVYGQDPTEVSSNNTVGLGSPFGWTNDSNLVYYGERVPVYEEIHINPCYTW